MTIPYLLKGKDPIDLYTQVLRANRNGEDFFKPLFVEDGLLCVWVKQMPCLYEYRLIEAGDLDEFEQQVAKLSVEGYELMFDHVRWNGKVVQWMSRLKALYSDLFSEKAVVGEPLPITHEQETLLVANVASALHLNMVKDVKPFVFIPYPIGGDYDFSKS